MQHFTVDTHKQTLRSSVKRASQFNATRADLQQATDVFICQKRLSFKHQTTFVDNNSRHT